jgi:hypothetical protein
MGTRGELLRAGRLGTLAAFGAFVAVASCLDPTEVTLVLTTDLPCNQLNGTSITVGSDSDVESKAPVTETSACTPGSGGDESIGTFVVVPSQGSSEAFAVRIVSGVDKPVGDCTPSDSYHGCIIGRRELAFVPHTPLTLPIAMNLDCLNVSCLAHQTCNHGQCVSAVIPDPHACTGGGCGADALPPLEGGLPPADGPGEISPTDSAGPDATLPDSTVTVEAGMDATSSDAVGMDAAPAEASGPDDASVLGSCVEAGSSSGVACAGSTCMSGHICCITTPASGGAATEMCTLPAACDVDAGGSARHTSFACRNAGDCPAATTCCIAATGFGYATSCVPPTSCPVSLSGRPACRNACECGGLNCLATTCGGGALGVCTPSLVTCL